MCTTKRENPQTEMEYFIKNEIIARQIEKMKKQTIEVGVIQSAYRRGYRAVDFIELTEDGTCTTNTGTGG